MLFKKTFKKTFKKVYALEGEQIVCMNGHKVATLTRDIYKGDVPTMDTFDPQLRPFDIHTLEGDLFLSNMHYFGLCPHCRAPFMINTRLLFEGEKTFRTLEDIK